MQSLGSPHLKSMRKSLILLVIAVISGSFAPAQKPPVLKIYAYTQVVLPGTKKNVIVEENGNTIEPASTTKMNYFFYAELNKSANIRITGIWMNGKKYEVKVDSVSTNPVEIFAGTVSNGSNKIVLTPDPGNRFLQILPGKASTRGTKLPSALKGMVKANELVLVYLWQGKIWYSPAQKIKNLSPVASE